MIPQTKNLSSEYINLLKPIITTTVEKIKAWEHKVKEAIGQGVIDVHHINTKKHEDASTQIMHRRNMVDGRNLYTPFPNRNTFNKYCEEQCKIVNQNKYIRIIPTSNPWVYNGIMVSSVSYMSGVPVVFTMTLPSEFPRSRPKITYFTGSTYVSDVGDMEFDFDEPYTYTQWHKNMMCHDCKKGSTFSCGLRMGGECDTLAATVDEWDYYDTWETMFLCNYINVQRPEIIHSHMNADAFKAAKTQTIWKTRLNHWAVYFQLQGLFKHNLDHFPPGDDIVYGKITNTRPLQINNIHSRLVSVPSMFIPDSISRMGWEINNKNGKVAYTSEPMSLGRTTVGQEGYSFITKIGSPIFENASEFDVSFILSTHTYANLHNVERASQRTISYDPRGYKSIKQQHENIVWSEHGAVLTRVFAIWLTFDDDQFVVSVQETEYHLPYIIGGVPVGRLSDVFKPSDIFYLNIIIKTNNSDKMFTMDVIPFTKGVVCDTGITISPKQRPEMYTALVVMYSYHLVDEAKKYIKICTSLEDSINETTYSLMRKPHSTLGHTNDGDEYYEMVEYWKQCAQDHTFVLEIDAIHIDDNIAAFSVCNIEPRVKSLRDEFQYIVIGLKGGAGGPNYVTTHLCSSDTYKAIKLEKHLFVSAKLNFLYGKP
jgi:hypothetical protein